MTGIVDLESRAAELQALRCAYCSGVFRRVAARDAERTAACQVVIRGRASARRPGSKRSRPPVDAPAGFYLPGLPIAADAIAIVIGEATPARALVITIPVAIIAIPVAIRIASAVPIAIPVPAAFAVPIAALAVPIATLVAIAAAAVPISPAIVAVVTTLSAFFAVEATDVAVAVAAIPPRIRILRLRRTILREDDSGLNSFRCASRGDKRQHGANGNKKGFHV
jgi:hypothetical protein